MKNVPRVGLVGLALLVVVVGGGAPLIGCGGDKNGDDSPDASSSDRKDAGGDASHPSDGSTGGPDARVDAGTDAEPPPPGPVSVLTQHNDVARTGANLAETVLTTANVNGAQFGKLFCRTVDDEVYAQPLLVAGLDVPGHGVHDVLFVETVNDTVYAFDANDSNAADPLWSVSFLSDGVVPPRNTDMVDACGQKYTDFSGNMGIVSTPVIDPATRTMYLVARTKEPGNVYVHRLHAIDITTGAERPNSPMKIDASVSGTGEGGATITFDPQKQNQRTSLLLSGGVVYVGFSSHCDWGPYHGWLLGFDPTSLKQVVTFNTTPDGNAGAIWMGGQGPAADAAGDIYLSTGNGSVGIKNDPRNTRNRGESFLRLTRDGATMKIASWFTPFDWNRLEYYDLDLGSAGLLLVPETNFVVSGGKGGTFYVVDRTTMGGLNTKADDSQIVQSMPFSPGRHLHGAPVYWKGPDGAMVYTWAEYDRLKAFRLDPGTAKLDPIPIATSAKPAPDGMPGAMMSISSNRSKEGTGILWANLPFIGDANQMVVPGVLRAFDAANVGVELWNSRDNAARDDAGNFGKFSSPTVANGKVYLSTFSGHVCAYGLLPNAPTTAAPSGLTATATSKKQAVLGWADNSTDETSFTIERKEGVVGFAPIGTAPANATAYTDDTASPFSTYTYRVRAVSAAAPSPYSNSATVTMNVGPPAPRARISGAGHVIPAASTTTSTANATEYGTVALGASAAHTFTLENIGNAPLHVTGGAALSGKDAASFAVPTAPAATVAPGAKATFGIALAPTTPGAKAATVDIASDDPDQAHYEFALSGYGLGDFVGWWKLDETGGSTAADASGHGNTGAATAVTWVAGHAGNGGSFDGSASAIQVADKPPLDPTTAITIAAWIKPASWPVGANGRVLQKGAYDDQYRLLAEGGVLKLDLAGVGAVTAALPAVGAWSHVAGTYDGATLRLFVNGVQVASKAATGSIAVTDTPLCIGAKTKNAPAGDHFNGVIDEVRIYNRALSAAEVQTLAQ